jgi:hypothetical protein
MLMPDRRRLTSDVRMAHRSCELHVCTRIAIGTRAYTWSPKRSPVYGWRTTIAIVLAGGGAPLTCQRPEPASDVGNSQLVPVELVFDRDDCKSNALTKTPASESR